MNDVRLRFSPAPTGDMHIGNMRTALYNWLQARHTGGTFILRIEDTDVARSTDESIEQIQHVLRWAGLDWDEGPYLQSARFDQYLRAAQRLLDAGDAYECFCTEAEVRQRNEQARRDARAPGYDGRCRSLSPERRAALMAQGTPRSVRFATPDEGRSTFVDVVRGEVSVEWATISDFVIVRSNGTPVFFLANAIDDIDMRITHVLRGDDLLDSTHRVLALRRALGHDDQPVYTHMPMILGPGGAKLSKRHGAVSVEEYRDAGYLPGAFVNYLALLGWGPEDGREVLTTDELTEEFDVARVTPSPSTFDPKKLEWMNGEHIRRMALAELASETLPFARQRYGAHLDVRVFERAGRARARTRDDARTDRRTSTIFVRSRRTVRHRREFVEKSCDHGERERRVRRSDRIRGALRLERRHRCAATDCRTWVETGQSDARVVRRDRGHKRGSATVRFDRAARQRAQPSAAARGAGEARRRVIRLFRLALRTGVLIAALVFAYLAVTFVQVWLAARRDDARPSQAIIVLGAAQHNGRPSAVLAARLDHAIVLYRRHMAPQIMVTGGRDPGEHDTEAEASADYLHQHGIPESAIVRETTGRTSWESLQAAARFLESRHMRRVVLVSDPYHCERIEAIAHQVGLDAVTSPTRTSPIKGVAALQRMAGEAVRVAAGRLFGYARLDRYRWVAKLVPGLATL